MTTPRRHHAFSLIELLVVLAVIAVLSAFTVIGVSKARTNAEMVSCISRMRSLGSALQSHSLDNNMQLLQPRNEASQRWPILIAPYLGLDNRLVSRLYRQPIFKDPSQEHISRDAPGIFGYNTALEISGDEDERVMLGSLSQPDRFPILATSDAEAGGGLRLQPYGPPPRALQLGYTGRTDRFGPSPNYGTNALFLFADGHVEAIDVCNANQWPWQTPDPFAVR